MTIVVRQSERMAVATPGGNSSVALATASRGATGVSVIAQQQQPGGQNPAHYHDQEEVLVVQAGTLQVSAGELTTTLHAGDTLIIPAQTPHQVANTGAEVASWLLIAPAGVQFFGADGVAMTPAWAQ